jgi:nitrite reductase/ring-hydroxylating ferredoxin subunit
VFDVETGEPVEGPAEDPVPVFRTREVEGWVEVADEPGTE